MSYYGRGDVSIDFPGLARDKQQAAHPHTFQIYLTGCSGDVTASKYNDGTDQSRQMLADRLANAMDQAFRSTERRQLEQFELKVFPLVFRPRNDGKYSVAEARRILTAEKSSVIARTQAALTLSWRERTERGQPIDVPVLELGPFRMVSMPAETFVGYQLAAQKLRPDLFIMTPAFAESAPGYLPTDRAEQEGFVKEHGYDWVAPMPENALMDVLRKALDAPATD